jgi:hypothetical protein
MSAKKYRIRSIPQTGFPLPLWMVERYWFFRWRQVGPFHPSRAIAEDALKRCESQ